MKRKNGKPRHKKQAQNHTPEVVNIPVENTSDKAYQGNKEIPVRPSSDNLSFTADPRESIIREKSMQLQRRQTILREITAEGSVDQYAHKTIAMEGYIEGLRDSLNMAPPPQPPAAEQENR